MSVTIGGIPVENLPNLGVVTDAAEFVGDNAGTGVFTAPALRAYMANGATPEQYGAKGDGVTDDLVAINSAIASDKPVLFSAKTYVVSGPLNGPLSGQRLAGVGSGSTTISSTSINGAVFTVANHAVGSTITGMTITRTVAPGVSGHGVATSYSGSTDAVSQVRLTDLVITNQYRGLDLGPTDYSLVRDVIVDSCYGDGVCMTTTGGNSSAYTAPLQWTLDHVLVQKCNGRGYNVAGVSQVQANFPGAPMGEWKNVSSFANSLGGASFKGMANGGIGDIRIGSNSFFGADGGDEIYLETYGSNHSIEAEIELAGQGGPTGIGLANPQSNAGRGILIDTHNSGVLIDNCFITACSYEGVASSAALLANLGAPVIINAAMIINNGLAGVTGAQAGVTLDSGSACGMVISGGFIGQQNEPAGTGPQKYGVNVGRDAITIIGCQITGNATAPLNLLTTLTPANSYIGPTVRVTGAAGEYKTNTQAATVPMTTATIAVASSMTLPAGDWDVSGVIEYLPAGTTTIAGIYAGINTSIAFAAPNTGLTVQLQATLTTGAVQSMSVGPIRINQTTAGPLYLLAQSSFAVSTMACGGTLNARRVI